MTQIMQEVRRKKNSQRAHFYKAGKDNHSIEGGHHRKEGGKYVIRGKKK